MLFDAHNHAFRVLGGVPRRGIYDNMRTAVDKIGRGKERQVNARFSAMVSQSERVQLQQPEVSGNSQIRGGRGFHCLPRTINNDLARGAVGDRQQPI
jgi:hypothetical protein